MKLSSLKIDTAAIEGGEWVRDLPELGDLAVKVRGAGNSDWKRLNQKLVRAVPVADKIRGTISPDAAEKIMTDLLVDACLIDWAGIEGDDGVPVPYSKDKAREILSNPEFRKFRDAVLFAAALVGDEAVAQEEDDRKN